MDEINPFEGLFSPTQYDLQTPASQGQPGNTDAIQAPSVPVFSPESTLTTPNESLVTFSGRQLARTRFSLNLCYSFRTHSLSG